MRPALCLSVLLAACGGGNGGSTGDDCHGSMTLDTDAPLANTHFVMCDSSFISGEAAFDTGSDAQPTPTTSVTLTAVGVAPNSSLMCDGSGGKNVVVNDPTFHGFDDHTVPLLSTDCTITTTLFDSTHWNGSVAGNFTDFFCSSMTSCEMQTHPFTMTFVLQP